MKKSKTILINATAATEGGALTILNQFLIGLPNFTERKSFYIFVSPLIQTRKIENVTFIPIDTKSWLKRICWDEFGLKNWCKRNKIVPDLFISFQNTGVNYKNLNQLIYYHAPFFSCEEKFRFYIRSELKLILYKFVYPLFVKQYLKENTEVIVQTNYVKEMFMRRFHFPSEKIHIIFPEIEPIEIEKIEPIQFKEECFRFLFPAYPHSYKNHKLIIKAISVFENNYKNEIQKIRVHFTHKKELEKEHSKLISKLKFPGTIILEPNMKHREIFRFYKSVNALVFPSLVETFGLPLLEAAMFGLPVLVADLPYAREVLKDYDGAVFINIHDEKRWAEEMRKVLVERRRYKCVSNPRRNGWNSFFTLIENRIENKI